jgi:hypothetical protein
VARLRALAVGLGAVTIGSLVPLIAWDAWPGLFPPKAHDYLGATPLVLIALAYLVHQAARRPSAAELAKAILLAVAFLSWACTELWPDLPEAALFNDIAIALFVLDVFVVIVGWPQGSADEAFAEAGTKETGETGAEAKGLGRATLRLR